MLFLEISAEEIDNVGAENSDPDNDVTMTSVLPQTSDGVMEDEDPVVDEVSSYSSSEELELAVLTYRGARYVTSESHPSLTWAASPGSPQRN